MSVLTDLLASGCFYGIGLYVVMQPIIRSFFGYGQHYSQHKTGWKGLMFLYNIVMAVYSLLTFIGGIYFFGLLPWQPETVIDPFSPDCSRNYPELYLLIIDLFYYSKYVEFVDTIFLLVMNKPVIWLHYLHHIGAVIGMWFISQYPNNNGWIFPVFNGFVHTIMYIYYGFSIYRYKTFPRMLITIIQLMQFIVGNSILLLYPWAPCVNTGEPYILTTVWNSSYVFMVMVLFLNFFRRQYIEKRDE